MRLPAFVVAALVALAVAAGPVAAQEPVQINPLAQPVPTIAPGSEDEGSGHAWAWAVIGFGVLTMIVGAGLNASSSRRTDHADGVMQPPSAPESLAS